jgi:predicted amidohydrolase
MNPSSKDEPGEGLKMNNCRVALISFESQFARPAENLRRIKQWAHTAAGEKADLVCFPEVALQGYCDDMGTIRRQAETLDGPSRCSPGRRHEPTIIGCLSSPSIMPAAPGTRKIVVTPPWVMPRGSIIGPAIHLR